MHRIEAYPAKEGRNGAAVASLIEKFEVQKPSMVRAVAQCTKLVVVLGCCIQRICMHDCRRQAAPLWPALQQTLPQTAKATCSSPAPTKRPWSGECWHSVSRTGA